MFKELAARKQSKLSYEDKVKLYDELFRLKYKDSKDWNFIGALLYSGKTGKHVQKIFSRLARSIKQPTKPRTTKKKERALNKEY